MIRDVFYQSNKSLSNLYAIYSNLWQRRWKIGLVWILLFFAVILGANSLSFWKSAVKTLIYTKVWKTKFPIIGSIRLKMSEPVINLIYYSIMGRWFLAYRIRNSEFFAWDRNSYLTHVISLMGRIEKEKYHVDSVCIGCIGRHVTLSLGWRHCDVTMMSNLICPMPTSFCVVMPNEPPHDKTNNVALRPVKLR